MDIKKISLLLIFLINLGGSYAREEGIVSWYSTEACQFNKIKGCPTASGRSLIELEKGGVYYAAKWDAPFGTRYRICNRDNRRCVNVIIYDRGPNRRLGRKIDIAKEAFKSIAPISQGLAYCTIERLS